MEIIDIEAVIAGAGVVGLAVAKALAEAGMEVAILESEAQIGTGNSSRNSEVIHAGFYYPAASLKARLCVAGRDLLYCYCKERNIAHKRIGKIVAAISERQLPMLQKLQDQGATNGVDDLVLLSFREASALEPSLQAKGALFSPSTGIVDSHGLMLALAQDAEAKGAIIAFGATIEKGSIDEGGVTSLNVVGRNPMRVRTRYFINCAGIGAQSLARSLDRYPRSAIPPLYLAKGNYFSYQGRVPFQRLIYPLPEVSGLGIHLTLDLNGQSRFGPDVEWIDEPRYNVNPDRAETFCRSVKEFWPEVEKEKFVPAYSGIRPKLSGPGESPADFAILGYEDHGLRGHIHLFGIESPGLTSALAIADLVRNRLREETT